jgi:hypothetical protein
MVDNRENNDPEVEDQQVVQRVAEEIIEPALQKALAEARKTATAQESLSALATCYGGLLVDLMGKRAAATFLQGHAVHIVSNEEEVLNN